MLLWNKLRAINYPPRSRSEEYESISLENIIDHRQRRQIKPTDYGIDRHTTTGHSCITIKKVNSRAKNAVNIYRMFKTAPAIAI